MKNGPIYGRHLQKLVYGIANKMAFLVNCVKEMPWRPTLLAKIM